MCRLETTPLTSVRTENYPRKCLLVIGRRSIVGKTTRDPYFPTCFDVSGSEILKCQVDVSSIWDLFLSWCTEKKDTHWRVERINPVGSAEIRYWSPVPERFYSCLPIRWKVNLHEIKRDDLLVCIHVSCESEYPSSNRLSEIRSNIHYILYIIKYRLVVYM